MRSFIILAFSAFMLLSLPGFGQDPAASESLTTVTIKRLSGQIKFDGRPDEQAWQEISPFEMTMHAPVFGREPSERSDIRIAFDSKYLYVGASLFYEDASMIRSASFKRDYMGMGSDWLGIMLDTFNDNENSVAFFVTPDALRFDASIQRDARVRLPTDIPMNISYNTFWDVMTQKDQNGWYTELRIPISSLRFQVVDDAVRMGLTIERWIPARNETDVYPAIPPNWGQYSVIKPSEAQDVEFHGIEPDKPLYIAPYILGGYNSANKLNDSETGYENSGDPVFEAGLDVKYGLTDNLVLDLTANTDFAQVESDDQQINLTRYSLYFPEKRLFFLERASVFDFNTGGNNNLFYSRRIGLSSQGQPIRIYGGARLTGRIGKWDVGFLDMHTAPLKTRNSAGLLEEINPSENFGVLRMRRQVINPNSYIGAMGTSRLGADGSYNFAYGVDGIFRIFGDDYIDIKWAQTFEDSLKNSSFSEPLRFTASWERRTNKGLGYEAGFSHSGETFNPGIGFMMMQKYQSWRLGTTYGWIAKEESPLYWHSPELRVRYHKYVDDGSLMTLTNTAGWSFQTKSQWQGEFTINHVTDMLRDSIILDRDNAFIAPGKYRYVSMRNSLTTPGSKAFFVVITNEAGQYYDGNRFSINLQPTWNLSAHLELGGTYNFDYVKFRERNQTFRNHIVGFKGLYMLNTRLSVNAFVQYNTAVDEIVSNFRIRYNPREGNDLFLVFNEGRNTDLTRETPQLPVYNVRTVMIKYTYTFNL